MLTVELFKQCQQLALNTFPPGDALSYCTNFNTSTREQPKVSKTMPVACANVLDNPGLKGSVGCVSTTDVVMQGDAPHAITKCHITSVPCNISF